MNIQAKRFIVRKAVACAIPTRQTR